MTSSARPLPGATAALLAQRKAEAEEAKRRRSEAARARRLAVIAGTRGPHRSKVSPARKAVEQIRHERIRSLSVAGSEPSEGRTSPRNSTFRRE